METERGIKEWCSVIEALGSGKQTILIRKRPPIYPDILLFPTFNYYQKNVNLPEVFDAMFQPSFAAGARTCAQKTMKQAHEDMLADINYWAHVDQIVEVTDKKALERLKKHYIWSPQHVTAYADSANGGILHVMILRVNKLPQTTLAARTGGGLPDLYKHYEKVKLDGSKPVMSDAEFAQTKQDILSIIGAKARV